MMGMRGRRCLILQVLSFAQGALKSQKGDSFEIINNFSLEIFDFLVALIPF